MGTKIEQKTFKTKYLPKAMLKSEKINFGNQVDQETGEILYKQFQGTIYVPKGDTSTQEPKVGLSIKLGNGSVNLITDDADDLERAINALGEFIARYKETANIILTKERNVFWTTQKQRADARIQPEQGELLRKS